MKAMHNRRKLAAFMLAVAGLLLLAAALRSLVAGYFAPQNNGHLFLFADNYNLNNTLDGSLVVVGGAMLQVEPDAVVQGDVALIGESVIVAGRVKGDLTVMAATFQLELNGVVEGNLSFLGESAFIMGQVQGDVTTVGESFKITQFGKIDGGFRACQSSIQDDTGLYSEAIARCKTHDSDAEVNAALSHLWENIVTAGGGLPAILLPFTLAFSFGVTGLAALAVTLFPASFSRIEEALLTKPARSLGAGFAALLLLLGVGAGLVVATALLPPLGLILSLVALLGLMALLLLVGLGWSALALLAGHYVLRLGTGRAFPPLMSAVIGSLTLFGTLHLLALLPGGVLMVPLLSGLLACTGLGAAVATRAGRRTVTARYFVQG